MYTFIKTRETCATRGKYANGYHLTTSEKRGSLGTGVRHEKGILFFVDLKANGLGFWPEDSIRHTFTNQFSSTTDPKCFGFTMKPASYNRIFSSSFRYNLSSNVQDW